VRQLVLPTYFTSTYYLLSEQGKSEFTFKMRNPGEVSHRRWSLITVLILLVSATNECFAQSIGETPVPPPTPQPSTKAPISTKPLSYSGTIFNVQFDYGSSGTPEQTTQHLSTESTPSSSPTKSPSTSPSKSPTESSLTLSTTQADDGGLSFTYKYENTEKAYGLWDWDKVGPSEYYLNWSRFTNLALDGTCSWKVDSTSHRNSPIDVGKCKMTRKNVLAL